MYQTIESKSPLLRKGLLLAAGVLIVGGVIYGTKQFSKNSNSEIVGGSKLEDNESLPDPELLPEEVDDTSESPDITADSVKIASGADKSGSEEIASPEEPTSEPAEKLIVNERVIRTKEGIVAEKLEATEKSEVKDPVDTQINRITVVEQPDLSDVFQVSNYIKDLNITATTQDGKKVIIDNEVFYVGDFIEGSQTIKYLGRSQDGVLLFGAHGKKISLRL